MEEQFARTGMLLGEEAMEKLFSARVAVFGLGGVGGYAVEALARSGIGTLDLIDPDRVDATNINRQILATWQTVGRLKVDIAAERIRAINPKAEVFTYPIFFLPDTAEQFDFSVYDYVVDAIDTVTGKLELVCRAQEAGTPIISCMGAGNKMDASAFEVADIYETSICPMARVMRRELKKRGVESLRVVYSREPVPETAGVTDDSTVNDPGSEGDGSDGARKGVRTKHPPGSNAFTPGVAGLILAGEVVRGIIH